MEGYEVSSVANGAEALRYLSQEGTPGLILLDLMMPVMDGWEFRLRQLERSELAAIPVVVLSGDGDIENKPASVDAEDYLMKPVKLDRLFQTLQRVLPG